MVLVVLEVVVGFVLGFFEEDIPVKVFEVIVCRRGFRVVKLSEVDEGVYEAVLVKM